MTEEEKIEETPEEKTKEETTGSSQTMIDKLNEATDRMEKANKEHDKLLVRQEELAVQSALGGKSEAGQPAEKKEETPIEYKNRVMSGEIERT